MKFTKAYVISYISPKWTPKQFEKRKANHLKQVEWLKAQGFDVHIFAQYKPVHSGVTYLPYDGGKYLPGDARNECLKHFYSTDDDFCCILDDDIILYSDKICSGNILDVIRSADGLLEKNISHLHPIVPAFDPYSEFLKEYGETIKTNLVLRNRPHQSGQFIILKNLKKHYNDEIYFEKNWAEPDGSVKFGEDCVFSMKICQKGYGSYKLWNFTMHDLGVTNSTHSRGLQEKEVITQRFRNCAYEISQMFDLRVSNPQTDKQKVFYSEFGISHGQVKEITVPFGKKGLDEFF